MDERYATWTAHRWIGRAVTCTSGLVGLVVGASVIPVHTDIYSCTPEEFEMLLIRVRHDLKPIGWDVPDSRVFLDVQWSSGRSSWVTHDEIEAL